MSLGSLILLHLQIFLGVVLSLYALVILRNAVRMVVVPTLRSLTVHSKSSPSTPRLEMPGRTRPLADFRILLQQSYPSQNSN